MRCRVPLLLLASSALGGHHSSVKSVPHAPGVDGSLGCRGQTVARLGWGALGRHVDCEPPGVN